MHTAQWHFEPNLDADENWVHRCIHMIEKHAPRLMAAGGGHLVQEQIRLSVEQRAMIRRMFLEGKFSRAEIAAAVGASKDTIRHQLIAAGLIKPTSRSRARVGVEAKQ